MTGTRCAGVPPEMRAMRRWMCAAPGSKVPLDARTGRAASASDPSTWADFATACAALHPRAPWLSFALAGDGLVGIDLDSCFDDEGFPLPWAARIVDSLGSYTERSMGGSGLHVVCRASLPFAGRSSGAGVEAYASGRHFVITGRAVVFREVRDAQGAVDALVAEHLARPGDRPGGRGCAAYSPRWEPPSGGRVRLAPSSYPPLPEGGRNSGLASLAGQMRAAGYGYGHILAELARANAEACEPPLPEAEVRAVARSMSRYER